MTITRKIHKAYGVRNRVSVDCSVETLSDDAIRTEQHHKEAVLPKNVIKKYAQMGVLQQVAHMDKQFGDVSEVLDLQEKLNLVNSITEKFNSLPAKIRKEFDHDPFKMAQAIEDVSQHERLAEIGILEKVVPEISYEESQAKLEASQASSDGSST